MVEEILMHESFYSLKYKGCYLVFNFVAEPSEEKDEENGELSFKPFCDLIKTLRNRLPMSKVY
jgi:hypothetical protein